ncbi:MAG: heat-inducible transcriptional repressor HrcA [Acidobacteriota bacterium]|nr:heat-inducible transcriptional repressor HrcA [Acidobacteriota bacterium]
MASFGKREQEILTTIVETYISTGEPVGSRTLARRNREGLSAATIRNVMADLADAGLLAQPHTSSGRVPSVEGYRYYAERLSGGATLRPDEEQVIQGYFHGVNEVEDFMERTSHVLSLMSSGVGVAVTTGAGPRNALEHVHFQRLAAGRVLAIVVSRSGVVRDRVLRMPREVEQKELDLAARYINDNFRGWMIEDVRRELERRIEQERSEYDRLMHSLAELTQSGALASEDESAEVFVEGMANLVGSPADAERLRQLLKALEEKARIVELLCSYLDVRQEAVRVIVGLQEQMPDLSNFVLIGAPARSGEEILGRLAVIGPTRMDYQHTITAVSYIARMFDKLFNDSE